MCIIMILYIRRWCDVMSCAPCQTQQYVWQQMKQKQQRNKYYQHSTYSYLIRDMYVLYVYYTHIYMDDIIYIVPCLDGTKRMDDAVEVLRTHISADVVLDTEPFQVDVIPQSTHIHRNKRPTERTETTATHMSSKLHKTKCVCSVFLLFFCFSHDFAREYNALWSLTQDEMECFAAEWKKQQHTTEPFLMLYKKMRFFFSVWHYTWNSGQRK